MKKWNEAEIVELNIAETAATLGDIWNAFWENVLNQDFNGNDRVDTWEDLFGNGGEGGNSGNVGGENNFS